MANVRKLKRAVIREELVAITGDFIKAVLLAQFLYWAERVEDFDEYRKQENERAAAEGKEPQELSHGWIYKSAESLAEETMLGLSKSNVLKHIDALLQMGFIDRRTNPEHKMDRTYQYRVNLNAVANALEDQGYSLEGYTLSARRSPAAEHASSKTEHRSSKTEHAGSETEQQYQRLLTEITSESLNTQEKENIKEKEAAEAESSGKEQGQERDTDFVAQVVAHLNEVSGSSFRAQTESTRKAILARRGEGYGLEDFRSVIDDRWAQWKGSDMEQYMRPDTLFRPSKFESYLSEAKKHAKASGRSPYNPERSVGLSDLVEYPPCSGRYRPWWEVPEKERAQYERN